MIRALVNKGDGNFELSAQEVLGILKDDQITAWVDMVSPTTDELDILTTSLGFHPLAIEDVSVEFNLPKIDAYPGHLFIVWHAPLKDQGISRETFAEVDFFVTSNLVVTVHNGKIKGINDLFEQAKGSKAILGNGSGFTLHAILDFLVDEHYLLIDEISDEIDQLEDEIFTSLNQEQLKRLFIQKRRLLATRKIVAPQRQIISVLVRHDNLVGSETYLYFQDILDHLIRILDFVDTSREVVSGAMEIYLSNVSNKMNEVMKRLTIVATVFMPLTLVTSLYGMNFKNMPELSFKYGYFFVLAFMFIFSVSTFIFFKRKHWW